MKSKEISPSQELPKNKTSKKYSTFISDLTSLLKLRVLIANVLPVFVGFWLALYFNELPLADHWGILLLTMAGGTAVMAGALILNNWYDADIDKIMDRTKRRPTVTGNFSLKAVFNAGIATSLIGLILLLFTTMEAALYGVIGWFTYVVLYSMWSKRRYTLNTVIGSVSGAVTPLIGWAAIDTAIHPVPIVLFLLIFIWQIPHTFAIAIKKFDEYKAAGVAMLPVVHGIAITKRQMLIYIICLLPLPFLLYPLGTVFIVVSSLLTIGWIVLSMRGFFIKDNWKWAHMNFLYSVNYLNILFILMVILTLPVFVN